MTTRTRILLAIFGMCCLAPFVRTAEAESSAANPHAVATFECLGLYFDTERAEQCTVRYRKVGQSDWRPGLDLVYDPRDGQYRGSLVGLEPDTEYEIQLDAGQTPATFQARTLSETFPVGRTTCLDDGELSEPLIVTESGSPTGYHLITPKPEARTRIDVRNSADSTIRIDADYVIIRGLELLGAARNGITIHAGRHHIVIEDCHIAGWGRDGGSMTLGHPFVLDSGVFAEKGAGQLVIQRNLIEHPRGGSNDWSTGHPNGPQAISLINSTGGNIIRYNEIQASEGRAFNDGIGGGSNFSFAGSPNCDSDIYGNIICNTWDDAIESEGANRNVRIWANYIDQTYQAIATASTSKGPLYIFRNVIARSRCTLQTGGAGCMIKTGQRGEFAGGRRFIFHNTAVQPGSISGAFSGRTLPNGVTRNNLFACSQSMASPKDDSPPGDFDYDYFSRLERSLAEEPHGLRGSWAGPMIASSHHLEFYPTGSVGKIQGGVIPLRIGGKEVIVTDPMMRQPNPLIDAGAVIPGFNDDYAGQAPDIGAFEVGRPPIKFGRSAGGKVWAPWERK